MKTILLIDDNQTFCTILADWLGLQGFQSLIAEDGAHGIELAQQFRPDMIFCEISMPEFNGLDVLKNIRGHAQTAHIPFIFLTSESTLGFSRFESLGANGLVLKSGGLRDLRQILIPLALSDPARAA